MSDPSSPAPPALLDGKVACITGGLTGIGRAVAIGFIRHGARVAINCLGGAGDDDAHLQKLQSDVAPRPASFLAVAGDVADPATGTALVKATVDQWGRARRLRVQRRHLHLRRVPRVNRSRLDPDLYSRTVRTNLDGSFYCVQAAARQMASQTPPGGSIVGISSISALVGGGLQTHYTPTKAGVLSLMQSCAVALGKHHIRCNALLPGIIKTQLNDKDLEDETKRRYMEGRIPLGRTGVTEDMVGPAVFLASGMSGYVTGAQLLVDGGLFVNLQ